MLNSDVDGIHSIPSGFEFVANRVGNKVKPFIQYKYPATNCVTSSFTPLSEATAPSFICAIIGAGAMPSQ